MNGNDFVMIILRSPFHPVLSGTTMGITVWGRKTGREITLPVNYMRHGEELWVLSDR